MKKREEKSASYDGVQTGAAAPGERMACMTSCVFWADDGKNFFAITRTISGLLPSGLIPRIQLDAAKTIPTGKANLGAAA